MMATQLSKADRIRKILHLSNAEIVRRTGYLASYVTAVRGRTDANGQPIRRSADLSADKAFAKRRVQRRAERRAS